MANKTRRKRKAVNLAAVESLLAGLKDVAAEFDESDPESTEVALDVQISKLIKDRRIKARRHRKQWRLDDVFKAILDGHAPDELIERAQAMQDLINGYLDEPSEEDMEEAMEILQQLIQHLEEYLKAVKAQA
jgi:hypothetical protein